MELSLFVNQKRYRERHYPAPFVSICRLEAVENIFKELAEDLLDALRQAGLKT